jgi:tetratricopeptide (TPR) repeat protein
MFRNADTEGGVSRRRVASLALAVLIFFQLGGTQLASAQTGPAGNFDELSRRAAAALQSNPTEAANLYQQALALQPSWAEGWFYLAASLYQLKQFPKSRRAFQRTAELAPDNGTVWAFLGLCEDQMGHHRQALADMQKGEGLGLGDNQQFISTIRNRAALIHLRALEFGAAMEQLEPLAKMGHTSPATIEAFGVSALAMPHLPSDVPADKQPLVHLAGRAAWAFFSAQRDSDAAVLFRQLVEQYPNEPGVHHFYGVYLLARDPAAALAEFRKELQINPSHVPARVLIATLQLKGGDADAAVVTAREAIKLQPTNPFGHLALGRAFLKMEQVAQAIPEFETAARLAPEDPQPHFYLAQAYVRIGRTADAQKEKTEFTRLKSAQDPLLVSDYTRSFVGESPSNVR